jgi:hypothetical protein
MYITPTEGESNTLISRLARLRNRASSNKKLAAITAVAVASAGLLISLSFAATPPNTNIAVNGNGGDRTFDGVGAVLGGGGNARYLMDYPEAQRDQILDYMFEPDYGASLQLLKLEIGGDAFSSDGAEASVEHANGQINCNAGYELSIAQQAVALNPNLKLYGLQWAAPGWVGDGSNTVFTNDDTQYLLSWLNCAKQDGLTISYLGGWNESDDGTHAAWYASLRSALNSNGYSNVQIVAADTHPADGSSYDPTSSSVWSYTSSSAVSILGNHDVCGDPTGSAGPLTQCYTSSAATSSGKPLWASELGAMDAGAQTGCTTPCAPAMDRALTRGYIDARLTGYLEWPAIDAMPPDLNYENRGLLTADQPWSGNYSVNAMTWAIAQFTQFVQPGWVYIDSGSGYLQNNRSDGSYVTLRSPSSDQWTTMIETTAGPTAPQQVTFTVSGSSALATKAVHVWASNFNFATDSPSQWFVQQPTIQPNSKGQFTMTVQPGYVYTLTTTTGQSKGTTSAVPAATPLALPYTNSLSNSGNAGTGDDEPPLLASMSGSFELAPCKIADGSNTTCTEQTTPQMPVLWQGKADTVGAYYPYAVIGTNDWANYTTSTDVLFTKSGSSAGIIGRFSGRSLNKFDGYVFDVNDKGAWEIARGDTTAGLTTLASGQLGTSLGTNAWHTLSLTMSGSLITASVDGTAVGSATDSTYTSGLSGLEAGITSGNWPQVQYSNLSVNSAPAQPSGAVASAIVGKCLDDSQASTDNDNKVDISTCNNTAAQQWQIETNGTIQFSGHCLDISKAGTANGTKVDLFGCNGGANQQWKVVGRTIVNPQSGKCLDDPSSSTVDGTQLDIYTCNNTAAQQWQMPV